MVSKSSLNMGNHGLKTRSLGQIIEKRYHRSRGHIFHSVILKIIVQIFILMISRSRLNIGQLRSKTRSLGQIIEKTLSPQ